MNDELSPSTRALLDAAREGLSPDAATVQRMRAQLTATTAGGAAAAGTVISAKLVLIAVIVSGVGAYALRSMTTAPARGAPIAAEASPALPALAVATGSLQPSMPAGSPQRSAPGTPDTIDSPTASALARSPAGSTAAAQPAAPATALPASSAIALPSVATAAVDSQRASTAAQPPARSAAPARPPGARQRPAGAPPSLAREVELVDLAMASLRRGDLQTALAAVRRHASETAGHGQLAEDAAAIEVEALCQLHDPSTARKLAAFDARFPSSAQRSRLASKCP
jgi:hypothetical protein